MTIEPVDHDPRPVSKSAAALPPWTVPAIAVAVLVFAGVVLVVLWQWIDTLALTDPEKKAAAHLDAVKVASAFVVAGGGLFALYLAARRQRTQEQELATRRAELAHTERVAENSRLLAERTATATEHDAAQGRVTDIYTQAVEQLGSDKAPVRLGGLYALERLAQDNPTQRQTIVNVWCAYLRMPYTPPKLEAPELDAGEKVLSNYWGRVQEREVRLTAQRLLRDHLRPGRDREHPAATFWADIDIDLTGAALIDFNLDYCTVRTAVFVSATFTGRAVFVSATFTSDASFDSATFTSRAVFVSATFIGRASFGSATFTCDASFDSATFTSGAFFFSATFTGDVSFFRATFTGLAVFVSATFTSGAFFESATITGDAAFNAAAFANDAPPEVRRFLSPRPAGGAADGTYRAGGEDDATGAVDQPR